MEWKIFFFALLVLANVLDLSEGKKTYSSWSRLSPSRSTSSRTSSGYTRSGNRGSSHTSHTSGHTQSGGHRNPPLPPTHDTRTSTSNQQSSRTFLQAEGGGASRPNPRLQPESSRPTLNQESRNTGSNFPSTGFNTNGFQDHRNPSAPPQHWSNPHLNTHQNTPETHIPSNRINTNQHSGGFSAPNQNLNSHPYVPGSNVPLNGLNTNQFQGNPSHLGQPLNNAHLNSHPYTPGMNIPLNGLNTNQYQRNPSHLNQPLNNPYLNTQQNIPNSNTAPIGFHPNVLPQNTLGSHPSNTYTPSAPYPTHNQPPLPGSHLSISHISGSIPAVSHSSAPLGHSPNYHPLGQVPPMGPHLTQSGYSAPPGHLFGNPYSAHPVGSPYAAGPALYPQQGHVLAQPAVQPYVPGQTVIMVPGQQERGLGQVFKEALVFSTVNAGVNRLLNPHHDHHYIPDSSRPSSDVTTTTTHITYNNQYFNSPGTNTTSSSSTPQGAPGSNVLTSASNPPTDTNSYGSPSANGIGVQNPSFTTGSSASNSPTETNSYGAPSASGTGIQNSFFTTGTNSRPTGVTDNTSTTTPNNINNMQSSNNTVTNNDNVLQYKISDEEISKITEELFERELSDVSKYIALNLQNRSTSDNITDKAKERLFNIQSEVYEIPSIRAIRSLYDNYEQNSRLKETITLEERKEQNLFLDILLDTNVMARTMQWLADNGFIDPDDFERKEILRQIWFLQFDGSTSGFERIFMSEIYGNTDILGIQNWIYFDYQESMNHFNYMGYVDKLNLGTKASLLKLNVEANGIIRPNATIFVGTTPELEMSLYTICFYVRPNNLCPLSLGGTKFHIFTHSFRYFGRDLIDLGLPIF